MVDQPEFHLEGDEYLYKWHGLGVGLKFSQLRELDSGAIRGFINLYSMRPDAPPGSHWWNQVSLATQTDRNRTLEKLVKLVGGEKNGWEQAIDWVYQDCARRFTAVPDPEDLADGPEVNLDLAYLIEPVVLANQVNMFLADQGSTKSYLLLYLAVCIATGRVSIFGKPSVTGPVVFYDWEVDRTLQRRRLEWICRGLGMDVPKGIYYQNMSDRGRIMDRARDMRQQLARVKAVATIVDSLSFGAGGDLNATEISAPTMAAIGGLGADVTKLVTAHPPKSSRKPQNGGDDVSAIGSGLFEFRARNIWRMKAPARHGRGGSFVVTMSDRKMSESGDFGEMFYRITFDNEQRSVSFQMAQEAERTAQQAEARSGEDAMLEFLARRPYQQDNTTSIARGIRTSNANVRSYAKRLVEKGRLFRVGNGTDGSAAVWRLSNPDTAVEPYQAPEELPL